MPENEFEKQVQQKMNELHLVPSDQVWPKVKKEIAARKKRRPLLLWLSVVFLLIGGASIYFFGMPAADKHQPAGEKKSLAKPESGQQTIMAPNKKSTANKTQQQDAIADLSIKKTTPEHRNTTTSHNDSGNTAVATTTTGKKNKMVQRKHFIPAAGSTTGTIPEKKTAAGKTPILAGASNVADKKHRYYAFHKKNGVIPETGKPNTTGEDGLTIGTRKEGKDELPGNSGTACPIDAERLTGTTTGIVLPATGKDSLKNTDSAGIAVMVKPNEPAINKIKKMQWGIQLAGGATGILNGFAGFAAAPAAFAAANTTVNNMATGAALNKPGPAFTAGIFVSKALGRYYGLHAGLNYHYSSTRIQTGARIDSNRAAVEYYNGNTATRINRFHFIELPVMIEKQLGTTSRFSINGGITFSLLAGSHVLQYNEQKNIYTVNNSNIHKTQIGLMAGFYYRLNRQRVQIQAGPQVSYHCSNIFKSNLYGNSHFIFAGIGTKIFFLKKKR